MRRNGAQRSLREEYEVDEKSLCRGAGAGEDGDKEDQTAVLLTQLFDNRPVTHVLKEAKFCFPAAYSQPIIFTWNWKLNSIKTSHVKMACSHLCVSDAYLSKDRSPQSLAVHAVL
ncbi:hypothetical protein GH733_008008, partial [Mirounga leonina]